MKKWYKSKWCKGVLIGMFHIAVAAIVLIGVDLFVYNNLGPSLFMSYLVGEKYEDTPSFEERMLYSSYEWLAQQRYQEYFEEGAYKEKVIDINEEMPIINARELVKEPEPEEVLYKGEDLLKWAQSQTGIYSENVEDMIVVCQSTNEDYAYYYYGEFRELVEEKKLQIRTVQGETSKTILQDMENQYYADMDYSSPIRVLDEQGNLKYEFCWTLDTINEEYLPINGKSLLDIAETQEHWNGRLRELIQNLSLTLTDMQIEYRNYLEMQERVNEETNLTYMLVNLKNEQVYSNVEKYTNFKQYEENLTNLESQGKYIKIMAEEHQFQTNLGTMRLAEWEYDFIDILGEEYIYVVAMDTSFPIQDFFYEQKTMYEATVSPNLFIGMVFMLLVSLIWLTIVAGRTPMSEEVVLNRFDSMKSEVAFAILVAIGMILMLTTVMRIDIYSYAGAKSRSELVRIFGVVFTLGVSGTIGLVGYLSFVRRIKARTLWKNSLLKCFCGYVKPFFEFAKEVFQNRKSTTKIILPAVGSVLFLFLAFAIGEIMFLAWAAIIYGVSFWQRLRNAIDIQRIRDGLQAIVEGNLDYQIPVEKMKGDQKEIAERINSMGEGLERAIEKSIKDERMKTELITNVSHDIKTPLTSIINYVDLLKRENFQDIKIQGYLKILEEKAQRLKTLTEDVMEASKVTSGNIQLEFTTVNLVEMIQQSEGEFEERFKERKLQFVMNYPEEAVLVRVDGKYMWRVLENLFSNVAKYAMEGTRVYGELQVSENSISFWVKNISATQLNITVEELTERFIRGDASRSTEGNGLGLSIAKSLVELQGGKMSLAIDGDLFKAMVELKKE